MKHYSIEFRSPIIQAEKNKAFRDISKYLISLANIRHQKLFLNYNDGSGQIFYETLPELYTVRDAILNENIYSFELGEVKSEMPQSGVTGIVKQAVVDIHGNKLALVEDEDCNAYVLVKDAQQSGFNLFDSAEAAHSHIVEELKQFLIVQAAIFLKWRNLKYSVDLSVKLTASSDSSEVQSTFIDREQMAAPVMVNGIVNKAGSAAAGPNAAKQSNNIGRKQSMLKNVAVSTSATSVSDRVLAPTPPPAKTPPSRTSPSWKFPVHKSRRLEEYPSGSVWLEKVSANTQVFVQVVAPLTDTSFVGFAMCPESAHFEEKMADARMDHELLSPAVGTLALVNLEQGPSRAYILELVDDGFQIAALEYAQVLRVDRVFELPEELRAFSEFVTVCEAPADYVKNFTRDDAISAVTQGGNVLLDANTKTPIACTRWTPPLAPATVRQRVYTSLPEHTIPAKVGERVLLGGFDDGVLFLRSRPLHQLIANMNRTLAQTGVEALDAPPTPGQYVLHCVDGKEWCRALVKRLLPPDRVAIQDVDYRRAEAEVLVTTLFNIAPSAVFGPTLLRCRLRRFEERQYSPSALRHMAECVKSKFAVAHVQDDVVDLRVDAGKCLSEVLLALDRPRATLADLPPLNFELNRDFNMMVFLAAEGRTIYFCPSMCKENMNAIMAQMNQLTDVQAVDDVVAGQLCMAMYQEDWTRAVVQEVKGTEASLLFIDFGNAGTVGVQEVKELPAHLLLYPPSVLKATITEDSVFQGHFEDLLYRHFVAVALNQTGDTYNLRLKEEIVAE